jgi:hypothetical protein
MKRAGIISGIAGLIFLSLVLFTNPTTLPSLILVVPFVLVFIIIWCMSFALMRKYNFTRLRAVRLSLIFAGLPVSLMLLQSIGQLTPRDIITIMIFFAVAYFYLSRIVVSSE